MRKARALRRHEKVELNRDLVIEAARRVFLARGYAGASLDAIAEEAGFSKGVVYSQFHSKADLFLTLLERRISERAEQNERILAEVASGSGGEGLGALLRFHERASFAEPEWALLLIEFRVHAARDPSLRRRYAEAHAQTIERLASVIARLQPDDAHPLLEPRQIAELVLAIGVGLNLERAANQDALPASALERLLATALGEGQVPAKPRQRRRA